MSQLSGWVGENPRVARKLLPQTRTPEGQACARCSDQLQLSDSPALPLVVQRP